MLVILGITFLLAAVVFWLWYDKVMADGFQWHDLIPTALTIVVTLAFMTPIYLTAKSSLGDDKMILNGSVVKKAKERTSCEHSYTCNCVTTRVGKTTSTTCQTCYEHTHDYDWVVHSDIGKAYIARVDRRGDNEPQRFTDVRVGEPFSLKLDYFNYIKASPLSVFKDYNAYAEMKTPAYPTIYDYYRVKHVVNHGSQYVAGMDDLNDKLSEALKTTSPKVKANALIVLYGGSDDLVEATRVKNYGGRINDLTVMIRADSSGSILNVGVFSWSKNDLVNVKIRDEIRGLGKLSLENNEKVVDIINSNLLKYYHKRSNSEFEYLEENIVMPTWVYVTYFFIIAGILGLNIFLRNK